VSVRVTPETEAVPDPEPAIILAVSVRVTAEVIAEPVAVPSMGILAVSVRV
jgi:hypothetical protein